MPNTEIHVPTKIRVTHDELSIEGAGWYYDPIPVADRTDMYPMGIYEAVNKESLEQWTDYLTGSHTKRYYQQLVDSLGDAPFYSWSQRLQPAFKSCRILQENFSFFLCPVTNYFLTESLNPQDCAFTFPHYYIPDNVYDWSVYRGSAINGYWDGHKKAIDENGKTHRSDYLLQLDFNYATPKWVFSWLVHPAMWLNSPLYEPCDESVWHSTDDTWVYPFPGTPREPTYLRVKYAHKATKPRWIYVPQTSSVNDSFYDSSSLWYGHDWPPTPSEYEPRCHSNSPNADALGRSLFEGVSPTDPAAVYKNFVVTNARWDYAVTIPKLDPHDMCAVKKLIGMPYYPDKGGVDNQRYRIRTRDRFTWQQEVFGAEPYPWGGLPKANFYEQHPRTTRLKIEVLEYVPHPMCILAEALDRCDLFQTLWEVLG